MRVPRLRFALALAAALALAPRPAAAQTPADTTLPPPGMKMRVLREDGALVAGGRFWYLRGDTLWLLTRENTDSAAVPSPRSRRLEVSRGRRRELWSALGAVTGLAVGMGVMLATEGDAPDNTDTARQFGHAVSGGAVGGILGGLTGWFAAPEKWRPVTLPPALPPPPAQTAQAPPPASATPR